MNYIDIKRNKQGITAEVNYFTTSCQINELTMFGKLDVMILITIPDFEDFDNAKLNVKIYNENLKDKFWGDNFISFNCYLSEINTYIFDEILEDYIESILNDEEINYSISGK